VTAEVRRLPEPVAVELRCKCVERRTPEPGAAGVAATVAADQDERSLHRVGGGEIEVRDVGERPELEASGLAATLVDPEVDDDRPLATLGTPDERHSPVDVSDPLPYSGWQLGIGDRIPPPRAAYLDEEPPDGLRGRACERLVRAERRLRAGLDRAHAGSLSARSRSSAGSIPSSRANAR
jgi:hypothetical protein